MKQSKIDQFFILLIEQPSISNEEAADIIRTTPAVVETYRHRLRNQGVVEWEGRGESRKAVILGEPKTLEKYRGSYKHEITQSMIEVYYEDFVNCDSFDKRVLVGREIRLLLERM